MYTDEQFKIRNIKVQNKIIIDLRNHSHGKMGNIYF